MSTKSMDQERLRRMLDECGAQVGRPRIWPEIRRRLAAQAPVATRRRTAFRLRWSVGLIVAALVIGTGVYAGGSLLKGAYEINPAWQKAAEQSHPVHLTQTQDDCTVTIEQAYADTERVVLGLSVQGPIGVSLSPGDTRLNLADGTFLPFIDGGGNADPQRGAFTWVLSFDASAVGSMPAELPLSLAFRLNGFPVGEAAPPIAPPENLAGDPTVMRLEPIKPRHYGYFAFKLTVPVSR